MWISKRTSVFSMMIGMAVAIPRHSKISLEGLVKSLSVMARGMLPKRVFARNSDMMLASTVGS
jgi:hypothetical protein